MTNTGYFETQAERLIELGEYAAKLEGDRVTQLITEPGLVTLQKLISERGEPAKVWALRNLTTSRELPSIQTQAEAQLLPTPVL